MLAAGFSYKIASEGIIVNRVPLGRKEERQILSEKIIAYACIFFSLH